MADGTTIIGAQAGAGTVFYNLSTDGAYLGANALGAKVIPYEVTYTLKAEQSGQVHVVTSPTDITVTLPADMPVGFSVAFVQNGVGKIVFETATGATLVSANSFVKSAKQYASVSLLVITNTNAASAKFLLVGEGAA